MGGRLKREGTCVYLWLIHVVIWQKPTQHCKAIILQLIINFKISGRVLRKAIVQTIPSVCLCMLHIAPGLCSGGSLPLPRIYHLLCLSNSYISLTAQFKYLLFCKAFQIFLQQNKSLLPLYSSRIISLSPDMLIVF